MTRKILTCDAAEILGVTPSRVAQLVQEGKLVAETVGERAPVRVFDRARVEILAGRRACERNERSAE